MRKIYLILGLCTFALSIHAQVSSYFCGFEDEAENAQWHLNTPKNESSEWPNLWTIGTADKSEGEHALYISNDGGITTSYSGELSRIMIAWRTLTLEAGTYDFALDWKAVGGGMGKSHLRVVWIPESEVDQSFSCGLNATVDGRNWILDNTLTWNVGPYLAESTIWNHSLVSITSDGTPHRLVFVWVNDNSVTARAPGACVDKIQIRRNQCGRPTNLQSVTLGQIAMLSWTSTAERFNLRLRRISDGAESEAQGITGNSVMMQLPTGVYEPYMQVICQGDTSVWYSFPVLFIYTAVGFNYLSLSNDRCFYSAETPSRWQDVEEPGVLKPGRIDYGFLSEYSRHTIHYYPDEIDPRTYNSIDEFGHAAPPLRTIPEGEIASVRIGSWELAARVARIVYDFQVDSATTGTLMIKYALVLQMSGHPEADRPRFTLKIVDAATGEELSSCTTVDFSAKTSSAGWYNVPVDGDITSDQTVCWRDWTSVGLNLNEFHGRKVRVILTAFGCTASIHYGYAYFTATCSSGQIQGIQCGDTPTEQFIAPDGFNYRWYLKSEPQKTLDTARIFKVNYDDDRVYGVDVTYKTDAQCGFSLSACAIPRYPIPLAGYKVFQKDCKNYIQFLNLSHIRTRNLRTGEIVETNYKPEAVLWDFDGLLPDSIPTDSIPWNPLLELPSEEADYHFKLTAIVGLCDSTQDFYVHVPAAKPDSIDETILWCEGHPYKDSKGRTFLRDTVVVDSGYENQSGCDSMHVLRLRFISALRDTTKAEIAEGDTYKWRGRIYTQSVFDSIVTPLEGGCDQIDYLLLTILPHLKVDISSVTYPCPDDKSFLIYISVRAGEPNQYALSFDEAGIAAGLVNQQDTLPSPTETIVVPLPNPIAYGWYPFNIRFSSIKNGDYDVASEVMVRYPETFVQQRWDDVLGILNAANNGGYEFAHFQWYRDNLPIEGATDAYLYEENKLNPNSEYMVLLTIDGQRGILTCPFVPQVPAAPASVSKNKVIDNNHLYIILNEQIYNAQGQLVSAIDN